MPLKPAILCQCFSVDCTQNGVVFTARQGKAVREEGHRAAAEVSGWITTPSKGVVPSSRPWAERTLRKGQPELINVQVRPWSTLSTTLLDDAPVARMRGPSSSNCMLTTLGSRNE